MKVTVIGSHLCPDTLYALNRLSEVKAEIEFKNLSASLPDLKAYLALRDSDPHYEAVKKNGGIDGCKTGLNHKLRYYFSIGIFIYRV